jgi:hypothetical protein
MIVPFLSKNTKSHIPTLKLLSIGYTNDISKTLYSSHSSTIKITPSKPPKATFPN